jgi:hypothetical protein
MKADSRQSRLDWRYDGNAHLRMQALSRTPNCRIHNSMPVREHPHRSRLQNASAGSVYFENEPGIPFALNRTLHEIDDCAPPE